MVIDGRGSDGGYYPTPPQSLGEIVRSIADLIKPAENLTVSEAAEKYRYISNPGSYEGVWQNDVTPYLVEVMNCFTQRQYAGAAMVAPAQSGKTDAIINWILHTIICNPMDMIVYEKSQDMTRDFSKRRVDRLHRYSKEAGNRLIPGDTDNTYDKIYRAGNILSLSWPTVNQFSGRPIGLVALTDYDRFSENIGDEGSGFDLATRRTRTFRSNGFIFAESSPSKPIKDQKWVQNDLHDGPPTTGIFALYNRGDRRRWYVPCTECEQYFIPTFSLLTWDRDAFESDRDPDAAGESVKLACPQCGALIDPKDKNEINRAGGWVPKGLKRDASGLIGEVKKTKFPTFWLPGPAASFSSWQSLVAAELRGIIEYENTGSEESLRTTRNTDQAEPFIPKRFSEQRSSDALISRATDLGERVVPDDVRYLITTIDIQIRRFVVQVHGFGPVATQDGLIATDAWIIDRYDIQKSRRLDQDGDPCVVSPGSHGEDWLLLDNVIKKRYQTESGGFLRAWHVGCDSGGPEATTSNAYRFWKRARAQGLAGRFHLIKGDRARRAARVEKRFPDSKRDKYNEAKGEIPVYFINVNEFGNQLDGMLNRETPGGGYINFPDWLPETFFAELCVEYKHPKKGWTCPPGARNESTDLLRYALALNHKFGGEAIDWHTPPMWALPAERNSLYSKTETEEKQSEFNVSDMAKRLG